MTLAEIEKYLSEKHNRLDESIDEQIEILRQDAIDDRDESKANYCWCIRQIYRIQKGFLLAINALKSQKFEDAWCILDEVDIGISNLENNFDVSQQNDKYYLLYIKRIIPEYQKLFPYRHFFSRECVIKKEECSICGKEISLRRHCGHKVGKLYMGELCLRNITDMEFKAVCIVPDPFDKYTYLKLPMDKVAAEEAREQKTLSEREQKIYNMICENLHLSVEQVMAELDISRATVFRDYAKIKKVTGAMYDKKTSTWTL